MKLSNNKEDRALTGYLMLPNKLFSTGPGLQLFGFFPKESHGNH